MKDELEELIEYKKTLDAMQKSVEQMRTALKEKTALFLKKHYGADGRDEMSIYELIYETMEKK